MPPCPAWRSLTKPVVLSYRAFLFVTGYNRRIMQKMRSCAIPLLVACVAGAATGCRSGQAYGATGETAGTGNNTIRADAAIRDSIRQVLDRALRDSAFP